MNVVLRIGIRTIPFTFPNFDIQMSEQEQNIELDLKLIAGKIGSIPLSYR